MIAGIVGTIIFTIRLTSGTINQTYGFLMLIMSVIIFIAAMISITPDLPKADSFTVNKEILELRKQIEKHQEKAKPRKVR